MWVTDIINVYCGSGAKGAFIDRFKAHYQWLWKFDPSIAWFLIYMFVYSQLFTSYFLKWHPSHNNGKRNYFLAIPQTSDTFKSCMKKILMGPIKVIVSPILVLAMILIVFGPKCTCGGAAGKNIQFVFWNDWCHHLNWSFLYFIGYALISIESKQLDQILKKYGVLYLFCGTCLLLIKIFTQMAGGIWLGGFYRNEINYVIMSILLAMGEWMYLIGLYATMNLLCIKTSMIVKILRELAMPFYLMHLTVINCLTFAKIHKQGLAEMMLWMTLVTGMFSLMIANSPGVLRYFFGLPSHEKALFSQWLKGFGPFAFLVVIRLIEYLVSNDVIKLK